MRSFRPRATVLIFAMLLPGACARTVRLASDDSHIVLARQILEAPNPAATGPHAVRHLYYGSGTDKRRREYRDSVTIRTATVDASPFVSMDAKVAKSRRKYWGFDAKRFPVNGRVWYPEGTGPFPLLLVVHGNHNMKEFSDPGYAYLGELLASRGYIVVSVDENFLNGSLRGENDARGWMLLKHLEAWRSFDQTAGGPFHGKVDLSRIALMGHSRGGEAVGHAAAFNRMTHYPDDANQRFDFGFGIRSIIAIAPVDGQYRPADRLVPVTNVNYLVFHGSHDGDVSTFHGLRQYQRVAFGDSGRWFKSAIYVYRANHGQWNTVWGNKDNGRSSARWLDLRALMDPEAQRQFARLYVSAFLEATLKGDDRYVAMFRDHRVAGQWLPRTMYITRYEERGFRPLATFEEDVNVTTATAAGAVLTGDSLGTWKEGIVPFRSRNELQNNSAVWLGWNSRVAGDDTTRRGRPASYTLTLGDSLATSLDLDGEASLSLLLAATDAAPGPRKAPGDSAKGAREPAAERSRPKPQRKAASDTTPVDLTIELVDADRVTARVPLSRFGAIRRPLETRILRRERREKQRFANLYELVLQSYTLPVADFAAANPEFDPSRIRAVRLVFDRTPAGTVIVDDIGFTPGPRAARASAAR